MMAERPAAGAGTGRRLVLASDLDGTLAGGSATDRAELARLLAVRPAVTLVYITGRSPDSARQLLDRASLPEPDVLIADVGTSVLRGTGPERVVEIEAELDAAWPGIEPVVARLAAVPDLVRQEVAAPRRVSYWIEPVRQRARAAGAAAEGDPYAAREPGDIALDQRSAALAARSAERAAAALEGLSVDVLVSANIFLDVLPRGVHKGSTLRRVMAWLGAADADCVVAGDSLNDLALFETGLRSIVVGNAEPALVRRVTGMPGVFRARAAGAAGVLEGLRHFGYFRERTERGDGHGQ